MKFIIVQSWTLFTLCIATILARLMFRWIMLKAIKHLQSDDWMMVLLMLPLTASTTFVVIIDNMSREQGRTPRYVLEELQVVITWLVKACLLVLYW